MLTTAAIGMFFPGPYRVPKASFNYKTVFSNTAVWPPIAVRGSTKPSRAKSFSTSPRARWAWIPSSCAARNLLRGDEMPYFNPNGMPYDHVAPTDTFEQAVKILDHEGFRKEQADALAQGRYIGLGFSAYIEPTGARDRPPGHRGRDDPHGADRQDQRLRQRRLDAATASRPPSSS